MGAILGCVCVFMSVCMCVCVHVCVCGEEVVDMIKSLKPRGRRLYTQSAKDVCMCVFVYI